MARTIKKSVVQRPVVLLGTKTIELPNAMAIIDHDCRTVFLCVEDKPNISDEDYIKLYSELDAHYKSIGYFLQLFPLSPNKEMPAPGERVGPK